MSVTDPNAKSSLLQRLGLHRPELRAWAMYDWANSAFVTTVGTAVFPVYFGVVATAAGMPEKLATQRYALSLGVGLAMVAVLAPILGAMADSRPMKKRFLAFFLSIGVTATAAMFF